MCRPFQRLQAVVLATVQRVACVQLLRELVNGFHHAYAKLLCALCAYLQLASVYCVAHNVAFLPLPMLANVAQLVVSTVSVLKLQLLLVVCNKHCALYYCSDKLPIVLFGKIQCHVHYVVLHLNYLAVEVVPESLLAHFAYFPAQARDVLFCLAHSLYELVRKVCRDCQVDCLLHCRVMLKGLYIYFYSASVQHIAQFVACVCYQQIAPVCKLCSP